MEFQIVALDAELFSDLYGLDDDTLGSRGVERHLVDEKPGFPCRVSLVDAEIGETVLLLNYVHQPADTPYHSNHAIFVREGAETFAPKKGEVPDQLRVRTLSVRAFDNRGMMLDAGLKGRHLSSGGPWPTSVFRYEFRIAGNANVPYRARSGLVKSLRAQIVGLDHIWQRPSGPTLTVTATPPAQAHSPTPGSC